MRKEIRRIIMFCAIVTVGLLLLVANVTFTQLLLLVIAIAIIMPFLLGLVTIAEVRTAINTFKEQGIRKNSFLKKLDDIKFFEKKPAGAVEATLAKSAAKPVPSKTEPIAKSKLPFSDQLGSLVGSFKSLAATIRERTKRERKVADINKMLDTTVSEKVEKSAPASAPAAAGGAGSLPAPGSAGSGAADESDPFLSLSGDDFDAGLLDGLDDEGEPSIPGAASPSTGPGEPLQAPDMGLPEPELSASSDAELDAAASDILKAHGADEGLDEFSGLDTEGGASDLGDLENISLDDVDLDVDLDEEDGEPCGEAAPAPEPAAAAPATAAGGENPESSAAVKTAWIPSDAPKDADMQQDQIGTQSDMASFAGGASGTDEDLLSSIASDVKTTTKEKDLSLLRELKDFKAPADQIEKELTDMYQMISTAAKPKDKSAPPTNEIK